MDFFGDDEDETVGAETPIEEKREKFLSEISQEIFKFILNHREHLVCCEILILTDAPEKQQVCLLISVFDRFQVQDLVRKLQQVKAGVPFLTSRAAALEGIYYPASR
jgi:hypothetical protein